MDILGGLLLHFREFSVHFRGVFRYNLGGFMVQFGGFYANVSSVGSAGNWTALNLAP